MDDIFGSVDDNRSNAINTYSEKIDNCLDKLDRLPGDFYELRNALNMTGNTVLAIRMDEFAKEIHANIANVRYSHHRIMKIDLKIREYIIREFEKLPETQDGFIGITDTPAVFKFRIEKLCKRLRLLINVSE